MNPTPGTPRRSRHPLRSDRGTAILEFTGMLPIVLFVGMAAIQLGIAGYAANQAGTAARAAARTEAQGRPGAAAGQSALSGWLRDDATVSASPCGDTTRATASITVPSIIGVGVGSVTRTVVMPCDDTDPAGGRP
ncbi:TadE/TadG family type IV pilus assembly protein [Streptomyces sp. NBC_00344]|uniref:TadE/TadG family type IV pilus assembly protein n=1 Tax=Streptomyces sp. NBC_00344 TaxID=2975720 RepID=UPI002E1B2D9F